jgi:hypothetical protein
MSIFQVQATPIFGTQETDFFSGGEGGGGGGAGGQRAPFTLALTDVPAVFRASSRRFPEFRSWKKKKTENEKKNCAVSCVPAIGRVSASEEKNQTKSRRNSKF